jgi:N-acetylglucosaminyl-diphospho-decaprenol L-rhamnosyltransferase
VTDRPSGGGPAGERATVIVPTVRGGRPLRKLLDSLADRPAGVRIMIVDNDSGDAEVARAAAAGDGIEVLSMGSNVGFGAAVNAAARLTSAPALIVVNDDCVCEPGFVEAIVSPLAPADRVTMVAGAMLEAGPTGLIDTAGVEVSDGLFAFDHLNGEPREALAGAASPLGPSGAAAAFDRAAFLDAGGFDETIFAYLEDLDLALRMRLAGGRCVLARNAVGVHEHSATLGSGSPRKNYLMGFGRGYLLRKWGVLRSPARCARVISGEAVICAGQLAFDRNAAGIRGRRDGLRAAGAAHPYPASVIAAHGDAARGAGLRRRLRRRLRARRRQSSGARGLMVVFHASELGGPARSLEQELTWLSGHEGLSAIYPSLGPPPAAPPGAAVQRIPIRPLMSASGPAGALRELSSILRSAWLVRSMIRREAPRAVIVVTTNLPGAVLAARSARTPVIVYAAELHREAAAARGVAHRAAAAALVAFTARSADAVVACSKSVLAEIAQAGPKGVLELAHPPVTADVRDGEASRFRERAGLSEDLPVLLAVGNVTRGRGQDVLVAAAKLVEREAGPVQVVVAGPCFSRPKDEAFRDELIALAHRNGVALSLPGQYQPIRDAYAAATVVVNPIRHPESFGRVACEALVAGRPVVATRVGAASEVLEGVEGVRLVEAGSAAALATAILATLGDSEAVDRAGRGGAEVLARYTPQQSLAAFTRALEAVADSSI